MEGRRCYYPRGKVLGGSSVLNALLHVRGNRRDYDNWAAQGNPGWSYEDVLPYFKKSENFRSPPLDQDGDYTSEYHGRGGYISLEQDQQRSPFVEGVLRAAREAGYRVGDANGAKQGGYTLQNLAVVNGTRCNVAKAFLWPARDRPNLHVAKKAHATRVLVDSATMTTRGVEFEKDGCVHIVTARKEVILSAGSVNTPQILMLSGIGREDHLKELGIDLVRDLAVGDNLQDHMQLMAPVFLFNTSRPQREDKTSTDNVFQYFMHRSGPLAGTDLLQLQAFVKSRYADPDEDYPDLQFQHLRFAHQDSEGVRKVCQITRYTERIREEVFVQPNMDAEIYIPMTVVQRPKSRGTIRLRSKDPHQPPLIDPRYLSPRNISVIF